MRTRASIAISITALLVAVFGSTPIGEAAWTQVVPRNSVGTPQLKRNAVKPNKLAPNAVRSAHVLNGSLLAADFKAGQLPAGPKGDKGDRGEPGPTQGVTQVDTFPVPPTLTSQWSTSLASHVVSTVTTTRAGRLLLLKDLHASAGCTAPSTTVWWWLTLDGTPVRGSLRLLPDAPSPFSLAGITEQSVPAGAHTVGVGARCFSGNASLGSVTVYSAGSVVVLG